MLKIDFTNEELDTIKSKIHFTELQERIIEYRRDEISIIQMADKEHLSDSKISKEIKKIKNKIKKVI